MQSVVTLTAGELIAGDVINFGEDLCFVVGTETTGIDTVTLVTEGFHGAQFVDYLNPLRQFTVVRTS